MLRIGDRRQFISGFIFVALGSLAFWRLPGHVGSATAMGPGYFPMLLSICLIGLGSASIVMGVLVRDDKPLAQFPLTALFFSTLGVIAFAALINRVGLAVALAALIALSCYERVFRKPLEIVVIYGVLLAMSWVIFIYFVQLPISVLW